MIVLSAVNSNEADANAARLSNRRIFSIKIYASCCSICSSVLPFVSGTRNQINTKPAKQMAAYNQNVAADPMALSTTGNVNVRINEAIHRAETAIETATPRMRLGNISDINTQVMGASDIA